MLARVLLRSTWSAAIAAGALMVIVPTAQAAIANDPVACANARATVSQDNILVRNAQTQIIADQQQLSSDQSVLATDQAALQFARDTNNSRDTARLTLLTAPGGADVRAVLADQDTLALTSPHQRALSIAQTNLAAATVAHNTACGTGVPVTTLPPVPTPTIVAQPPVGAGPPTTTAVTPTTINNVLIGSVTVPCNCVTHTVTPSGASSFTTTDRSTGASVTSGSQLPVGGADTGSS